MKRILLYLFTTIIFLRVAGQTENPEKLTESQAMHFADMAMKCITKEYPNKPGQVFGSDADLKPPREIRPAFYGCFDWHSAVHGHWLLVAVLKRYPDATQAKSIRLALDRHFTRENMEAEVRFFLDSNNTSFERTYGWAWLLKLAEELHTWNDPQGRRWAEALQPLTGLIVKRYLEFLPKLNYPIRVGEHTNTAFGLAFAWDYANTTGHSELKKLVEKRSLEYYFADKKCPSSWEPGGYDFFSPCLTEAYLMARILPAPKFKQWLKEFLPGLLEGKIPLMNTPARVSDRTDGKLVHLDGLNFNRAWCLYRIARTIPDNKELIRAARLHLDASLPNIASGDYAGEHWLATFAMYAIISGSEL